MNDDTAPAPAAPDVVEAWAAYRRAAAALAWLEADHGAGDWLAAFAAVVTAEAAALAHALTVAHAGEIARDVAQDERIAAGDRSMVISEDDDATIMASARDAATAGTVDLARWHMASDAAADVASAAASSAGALIDAAGFVGNDVARSLPAWLAGALVPHALSAVIGKAQRATAGALLRSWRSGANAIEEWTDAAADDPTDGAP